MSTVHVEAKVPAPIEKVWRIISDCTLAHAWMPDISERRLLTSPPLGIGSRWEEHGMARGKSYRMTCEVLAWEPPHCLSYQHTGARQAGVEWIETLILAPEDEGTLVQLRLDYTLARGGIGALYDKLFFRKDIRQTMENRLAGLREYLDQQEGGE